MFENSVYKPYYDTMYRVFSSWVSDFERYAKDAEHIRNNYLPDAGVAAMEKLRNDFRARTSKAIDNIMAAGNELHDAIAKNWTPNIFNYDEKVTALYGCKYLNATAADFERMAETYSKSPTMLMVLRGIAEERDVLKDVSSVSPLHYANRDNKLAAANDLARSVSAMMYNDDPSLCQIRRTTAKNFEEHVKRYRDYLYVQNDGAFITESVKRTVLASVNLMESRLNNRTNKVLSELAIQQAILCQVIAHELEVNPRALDNYRRAAVEYLKMNDRVFRLEDIVEE